MKDKINEIVWVGRKVINLPAMPTMAVIAMIAFGMGLSSCKKKEEAGPMEELGKKVDEQLQKAGDKIDQQADKVEKKINEAGKEVQKTTEKVKGKIADEADKVSKKLREESK